MVALQKGHLCHTTIVHGWEISLSQQLFFLRTCLHEKPILASILLAVLRRLHRSLALATATSCCPAERYCFVHALFRAVNVAIAVFDVRNHPG